RRQPHQSMAAAHRPVHLGNVTVVVETIESKRRSRVVRIGSTVGVVVAAGLVVWGFARANDDRSPHTDTPPTIGVIQNPAVVLTTQGSPRVIGTAPATVDVPVVPVGTADVAFPPTTNDIVAP
ncbi:MAG: hypothetical protein ACXV8L_12390, partial [Ilumatobacteraceae bacterium]